MVYTMELVRWILLSDLLHKIRQTTKIRRIYKVRGIS
jgi:hypothetical protein